MKAETGKKNEKWMFVRIWLRVGGPVLSVTAIVLYFLLYMVLISIESLGGSRVERNVSLTVWPIFIWQGFCLTGTAGRSRVQPWSITLMRTMSASHSTIRWRR